MDIIYRFREFTCNSGRRYFQIYKIENYISLVLWENFKYRDFCKDCLKTKKRCNKRWKIPINIGKYRFLRLDQEIEIEN